MGVITLSDAGSVTGASTVLGYTFAAGTNTFTASTMALDNIITGSSGADTFNFGQLADGTTNAFLAADSIIGGTGTADVLNLTGNIAHTLTITNVATVESIVFANTSTDVALTTGANNLTTSGSLTIDGSSNVTGTIFITGTAAGGAGTLLNLIGGAAIDSLLGGAAADSINGGAGADTVTGAAGADWLEGGTGADSITGGTEVDTIIGGAGGDVMTGTTGEADIYRFTGTTPATIAIEAGTNAGATSTYALRSVGDTILAGFTANIIQFPATLTTNAAGTEVDTLLALATGGTVLNTARFVYVATANTDVVETFAGAVTVLDALVTTAVAIGDSFVVAMDNDTNIYFYLVEQVSTSGTIAAQDVTFIGVSTGMDLGDVNGDFVSY